MEVLLKCREIRDGMFPQEKLVIFETLHDKHVELNVHHSLIKDEKFEVELVRVNKEQQYAVIGLPYAPINCGMYVSVGINQIAGAPAGVI